MKDPPASRATPGFAIDLIIVLAFDHQDAEVLTASLLLVRVVK